MRARTTLVALAFTAALAACSQHPNTQIVVHIDSDLHPGTELTAVRVVIHRPGQTAPASDRTYSLVSPSTFHLPGEVGIVARDSNDHAQVIVDVTAILADPTQNFTTQAIGSFRPGQTVELDVFLSRSCEGSTCATGQTCGFCGCGDPHQDPLPTFAPPDASTSDAATGGSCAPVHPPDLPPTLTNQPGCGMDGAARPLVFALQQLQFGFPPAMGWRNHGFDFDNLCSDPMIPSTGGCLTANAMGAPIVDGVNGRDNGFAVGFGMLLEGSMRLTEANINDKIMRGEATLGLRITNYGGGANDSQVTLELLPLVHGHPASNPAAAPRWDGNDVWHIDGSIAYDPMNPALAAVRVDTAYVVNGMLVAHLRSHSSINFLRNDTSYVRLTVSGAELVGPLRAGGSSLGPIEAGGFLPVSDMREDLPTLGLCPGTQDYIIVSAYVDAAADLYVVGDSVTVSPTSQCNAVSVGFGSTWQTVTLGPDENNHGYGATSCGDGGIPDVTIPPDVMIPPDASLPPDVMIPPDIVFPG